MPKIHISGCPSSCSAHQTGTIGFRGAVKQSPDGPLPACAIFIDGCAAQGEEVISEAGKSIVLEDIPKFLVELGSMISKDQETYDTWSVKNHDKLEELIAKYTA